MKTHEFKVGDVVKHFKRELQDAETLRAEPAIGLYKIIAFAEDEATGDKHTIYRALYGEKRTYMRKTEVFMSETDKEKYPEATQKYRFELFE